MRAKKIVVQQTYAIAARKWEELKRAFQKRDISTLAKFSAGLELPYDDLLAALKKDCKKKAACSATSSPTRQS